MTPKQSRNVRARKKFIAKEAWTTSQFFTHPWLAIKLLRDEGLQFHFTQKVIVLPADAPSYERMIEQGAEAECEECGLSWFHCTDSERDSFREYVRIILSSIGIHPPGKRGKLK